MSDVNGEGDRLGEEVETRVNGKHEELLEDAVDGTVEEQIIEDPELEAIKAKAREIEEETENLKQMQSEVEKVTSMSPPDALPDLSLEEKMEVDGRSVYVGNVDYEATAEELEEHFHDCGAINRVTILRDRYSGYSRGFVYVEFADKDSIQSAMALDKSLFRGREIKVMPKRTNLPGNRNSRGRYRGRGRANTRGAYFGYRPTRRP